MPVLLLGGVFASTIAAGIWVGANHIKLPFFDKDLFAAETMKAMVYWNRNELIMPAAFIIALLTGIILTGRKKVMAGMWTILIATCLFTNLMIALIVPRAEKYSQAAMIEFLRVKKGRRLLCGGIGIQKLCTVVLL